jgi:hypothetical protein
VKLSVPICSTVGDELESAVSPSSPTQKAASVKSALGRSRGWVQVAVTLVNGPPVTS